MRPRITNISAITLDVYCFSFESAGALGFDNEYSGFAVKPAHYITFAEPRHRTSLSRTLALKEMHDEAEQC
jgi:hypothetical protein